MRLILNIIARFNKALVGMLRRDAAPCPTAYLLKMDSFRMKITSLFVFAIAIICSNSYGWSGEGVPVISFKAGSYLLCESPKIDSTCKQKKIEIKKKIMLTDSDIISSSRIITISPVIMTATSDFLIKDSNTYIKKARNFQIMVILGKTTSM